jgi:Flp pilus assembly protein TadD/ketosteroid isomerase-like protein
MLSFLGRTFRQQVAPVLNSSGAFGSIMAAMRAALVGSTLASTLLFSCGMARADEFADISKHIRAGQFNEALSKVDAALVQRPKDAQMRFLKGLIYTEQNKNTEAIAIFTKMTEDFPDLPEPYNNLAVLYASAGQYDKAKGALEAAIKTHPAYATAYENLGDVYAKLASQSYEKALQADNYAKLATQAYDKALQLDANNSGTKKKLALVSTMSTSKTSAPTLASAAPAPAKVAALAAKPSSPSVSPAASPVPVQIAKLEPKPEPKPEPKVEPKKPEAKPEPKPEPKAEPKVEPKKVEPKPEPKPAKAVPENNDQDEALRALQSWARAWSAKDIKGYLNSYADNFQTPKGESRKAWADERRSRIESKGRINVQIEAAQVAVDGNAATIKFRQIYTSDKLTANSRKTVVLVKQGGRWLIKQEHSAS